MNRPRVWITGAGGFIASYLLRDAPRFAPALEAVGLRRPELDLADFAAVEKRFLQERPGFVLHCAAVSRAGECQARPERARQINVEATRHLAGLAENIPFLFFSTDLVFDGSHGNYRESDAVNPLSLYGETKAAAERVVLRNPRHAVVRLSLTAGVSPSGDRAFNEEMRRAWEGGRETPLFFDEFRCPLAAAVTSQAIWELLQRQPSGLYHLCGPERLSRVAIGEVLSRRWPSVQPRIKETSLRDFPGPPRPADSSMNCEKIQAVLSFPLPRFSRWLEDELQEPV